MSSAAELKRSDNLYIHPWDDFVKIGRHQRTLLDRGEGVFVYDSDGNRLLDAPAGMWCVNIGHGREEMAQAIYDHLLPIEKVNPAPSVPWDEIEPKVRMLLASKDRKPRGVERYTLPAYRTYQAAMVEKRCERWKKEFGYLFKPGQIKFHYDKKAWRQDAVEGDTDWDGYSQAEWSQMLPRKVKHGFWDSLWVNFHRAALRQRHFVLENMP